MKTFMGPTVRTTWAEEKRIRPDIMSFEAKEIDINLKKILSQKDWRLGLWARQFEGNVGVPIRSFNWSSWYFAEFSNIAVAVFFFTLTEMILILIWNNGWNISRMRNEKATRILQKMQQM